jgi:hypothetical protein
MRTPPPQSADYLGAIGAVRSATAQRSAPTAAFDTLGVPGVWLSVGIWFKK